MLGATLLLASGAGAAAYAALNSEAQRVASAPPPAAAAPMVEQPPAATSPTDAPPAEPQEIDPPASDPAEVPAPGGGAEDDAPAAPPAPAPADDAAPAAGAAGEDVPAEPVALDLDADAAATYDPYRRAAAAAPSEPARVVDGKANTAWEAPVAEDGSVRIGLALSLEQATRLSELELQADTPGFTVELYATRASELPPDVLDARWKHLRDKKDVGVRQSLKIGGAYRHVLVWITAQPADTKVAIPEIQLFEED